MSRRRSASSTIRRRIYIITVFSIYFVCIFSLFSLLLAVDSDLDDHHHQQQQQKQKQKLDHQIDTHDEESSNNSSRTAREGSFAGMIDRALEKEFTEGDQIQENDAGGFNNSVNEQQAVLETVARVKSKKNDTKEEKSFQLHNVFNLDNDNGAEETPTLIDRKDNVFIISNFKSKYPVLQLDLRLISDLVVVIVSATCGGIAFACAGQPVMTGYLLAGSLVGPGGLSVVSEMVQVETVAQFGVIFLLFALGLEFSVVKLKVVRAVAVMGGLLQIFLFMCLCGITASLCGGKPSEGVFVGAFLSMSSTAVVLKYLMEKNNVNALHGQVTVGTLILQDCAVGLLFALLPILGGTSGVLQGVISMTKSLVTLMAFLIALTIMSRTCVPWFLKLMISLSSQTNELYQLAAVAFCLLVAWCSDKLGLSFELGSFAAGVMIATTDLAQHTLEQERIPMVNLAAAFGNKGISAFRFDFTGNGESEGSFQYGNYCREADDLRNVVEFFHAEKRLVAAVIGHSKGGNVVLLYASKYSDVSTVANISGRFDLERGIEGRLGKEFLKRIKQNGFIDVKDRSGKIEYRVTEASLIDRLTTDMRAASRGIQQNCRVLTVHGSKDAIISVEDAMEFGKHIANHRMFVIELADHEYTSHQDELDSAVLDFVSQCHKDESLCEQQSCRKTEKIVHSRI